MLANGQLQLRCLGIAAASPALTLPDCLFCCWQHHCILPAELASIVLLASGQSV